MRVLAVDPDLRAGADLRWQPTRLGTLPGVGCDGRWVDLADGRGNARRA